MSCTSRAFRRVALVVLVAIHSAALLQSVRGLADDTRPPTPEIDYAPAIQQLKTAIEYEMERNKLPAVSIALTDQEQMDTAS